MSDKTPIELAAEAVGGLTKLSALLNLDIQVVSNWRKRGVPIERCVAIENATKGKVTRRELRPNDWRDIWPELASKRPKAG
jgi:DNA-binding transcriptional regulator YdaS (Cro superfamily)